MVEINRLESENQHLSNRFSILLKTGDQPFGVMDTDNDVSMSELDMYQTINPSDVIKQSADDGGAQDLILNDFMSGLSGIEIGLKAKVQVAKTGKELKEALEKEQCKVVEELPENENSDAEDINIIDI